ncbi:MAG: cation:proton antiporter [Chloroflexota bacterium]
MENYQHVAVVLLSFGVLAVAAGQIGRFFARFKLPLISGFLFAGILVGPFVLGLISQASLKELLFVDEVSLAFIAFAAGSEIYLEELRSRLRSIAWVTVGNAIAIPVCGGVALFLLSGMIPFMREMPVNGRIAASLLAGTILLARSPSSVIAIVNELRAKGSFTQTALGVTMVTDVVVIVIFAVSVEIADALFTSLALNYVFLILVLSELFASLVFGIILGKLLQFVLSLSAGQYIKSALILLLGYGVFALSTFVRHYSHANLPFEFLLEPLLIAMIGGFFVTNYSKHRPEFLHILAQMAPIIYIIFFTLTGASLALDILVGSLFIALILFAVRLFGIFAGSFAGGMAAGDDVAHSRLSWMAYVTQAGVGLGLAKEVAVEFPGWGDEFATLIIAVIVLSQIIGPPFFKWAIHRVGEAHTRAPRSEFDGMRDVIIFGLEGQALALGQQLRAHHWQVQIACLDAEYLPTTVDTTPAINAVPDLSLPSLRHLGLEQADAVVLMLSDDDNYRVCELLYEHFGVETVVVRLQDRAYFDRFYELGALIVEPGTAIVSLLEQFVRSPTAASLLLGMDGTQSMVDIEVYDANLEGIALRDLRLPLDTLVLSVHRDGQTIISHGYTQLKVGDKVTLVGSQQSLEDVALRFGML